MNKVFSFLITILLIFVIDLFHFETPLSLSHDIKNSTATDALAAFNDNVVDSNFGFGFKPAIKSRISGDGASKAPGWDLDPVIMLLFGGGLIGLAGLGRKKIYTFPLVPSRPRRWRN